VSQSGPDALSAADPYLRVAVDVDRELADVLDHRLEIGVRN
jgi:hypothetical protein